MQRQVTNFQVRVAGSQLDNNPQQLLSAPEPRPGLYLLPEDGTARTGYLERHATALPSEYGRSPTYHVELMIQEPIITGRLSAKHKS